MHKTLAFIGGGNMASSLIGGLIADGYDAKKIFASDKNHEKLQLLQKQFAINAETDNVAAAQQAEVIILAVKPQNLQNVAEQLADVIRQKKSLVLSIAAMIGTKQLEKWMGNKIAIVRTMPNLAALVRSSATALYANENVDQDQKNFAESIMRAVGITVWINDEKQMDIITALSGNGPAYFFLLMEILQESAEKLGLPKEIAKLLTLQTASGSTRLALESTTDAAMLRQQVTSPGGTTESALKVLEDRNIREIFYAALDAACKRATQITQS